MLLKRLSILVFGFFIAVFIAACGGTPTTGSGLYGGNNNPQPSSSPTAGSNSPATTLQTATATVKGQSQTVLTNAQGRTLYYFTADSATQSACSGSCAQMWPPLLSTASGGPTSSTSLTGTLSTQADANGSQVEYNGHLLYTFSGDTAPGQTNGEGLFGKWFVATPNLPVQSGGSAGGYGN